MLPDGKIVRQDIIGSPIEEDLKMWRHSELGKRILAEDEETLLRFNINNSQKEAVAELLTLANGK